MEDIYVIGIGGTRLGKFPDRSVKDLTREAVGAALSDAGIDRADLDAAWFSNVRQGQMEGQNSIRGQCALHAAGVTGLPIVNVENACASSTTGLMSAFAYLRGGLGEVALVAGADKLFFPEKKELMTTAFLGGLDIHRQDEMRQTIQALQDVTPLPHCIEDGGKGTIFMEIYAALARHHMYRHGTTARQIAAVAAKNHFHSTMNPLAQYRKDMSVDEVLADMVISWPLTRSMCAPMSDGAASVILCTGSALKRFEDARPVRLAGVGLCSGTDRDPRGDEPSVTRRAAAQAYDMAGVGAADIDLAELHDATAFAELAIMEHLDFCAKGEAGHQAETGVTRLGGKRPINTSGGLLSKGHPPGATGVMMVHEIVTQLRGEAGARQVENARFGMVENGGGFGTTEEAAAVVAILERA